MSHHYSSMLEQKHTWFWLYQAIGLAQGAGLHRETLNASHPNKKLWKRIWWGCVIRDRLVALGTGRPMHIRNSECGNYTFDMASVEEDGDEQEQRNIKALFLEFVKLCLLMEGIIHTPSLPEPSEHIAMHISALSEWQNKLPPLAQRQTAANNAGTTYDLHKCVLHMIYKYILLPSSQHDNI